MTTTVGGHPPSGTQDGTHQRQVGESSPAERMLRQLDERMRSPLPAAGEPMVGIDLGTAYIVVVATDDSGVPLGGASRPASVLKDGLVVDYLGAVSIVRDLVAEVADGIGVALRNAAAAYPPGISKADASYVRNVGESAGLNVGTIIEEPLAANAVLNIRDGAIVDVGGGTTGIAVFQDGRLVHVADEPTGGVHLTLTIAGARGIRVEAAEAMKIDPAHQADLFPLVRPVIEKVASIITAHVSGYVVPAIHLVGGTCAFPGFARVVAETVGIPAILPSHPLLVTPLGIALSQRLETRNG